MARWTMLLTCLALQGIGAGAGAANVSGARAEPLAGVITDQTMTAAGRDFYQAFSALWHDQPLNERFSIAIRERPSARLGNRIEIDYANHTIFEAVLPAARGNIRAISARAVEIAYRNVSDAEAQRLLFRERDLAGDEF